MPGTDLAAKGHRAYVVSRGAGAVVAVDLAERRVVAQSTVPDARAVAVSNEVWVVTGSELVGLDKERLQETARIPIAGAPCSVAAEGDRVFVSGTSPLQTEASGTTHQVTRLITDTNSQCGDIHLGFGSSWVSANEVTSSIEYRSEAHVAVARSTEMRTSGGPGFGTAARLAVRRCSVVSSCYDASWTASA